MRPGVALATKSYNPRGVTPDGQVRTMAPLTAIKDMGSADLHVAAASPQAIEATLARCRQLYASARSAEALPLALEALEGARALGDAFWMRRAGTACGLLSGDTADLVGAIEHHVFVLRIAMAAGDRNEASRVWCNLGLAMEIAGHYELATSCYRRALELVADIEGPVFSRYAVSMNLAHSLYLVGAFDEGLEFARKAADEVIPAFVEQDPASPVMLERNFVHLLVALGRLDEAQAHVEACSALAERIGTPRARIAATLARASLEVARGRNDVALTRLDDALAQARELPAALRDTLASLVRAEEAAGNVERALLRLCELSEHVYRTAIDRAHTHIELAVLDTRSRAATELEQERSRLRLTAKTHPPAIPEGWAALDRLAVGAALRMEDTGRHGKRVGTLVKALALASGIEPLQALEMGLAAELHDIGMMSVPAGILRKRAALNEAERAIVLRHVDAGSEILADDSHARVLLAREIVRYHHARWDGSGYPERVAGRRIPFAARACAVADAYDEMVCGIGTGKAKTMDEALEALASQAGHALDPELVRGFDELIRMETEDLGMDLATHTGMEGFQSLVSALQEDRGFV